ncbi:MAG: hemolysin III family protein [Lachnospiraceae bacterium]|nr:hemolysin III family protein [Lachnospiraceae bacterium]
MGSAGEIFTESVLMKIKDPGSAITHFIGFAAAFISGPFLIRHYLERGAESLEVFSAVVFMVSMMLLYAASTLYHTVKTCGNHGLVLKKLDHLMIFVLIAGTYTPICLTVLKDKGGIYLLLLVWGFAIAGMIFKLFWVTCPKWLSSVIYVSMGWLCVLRFPTLLECLDIRGFLFLLLGGIVYTAGGIIYALKFKRLNDISPYFGSHEIFHLFVLLGNALQFVTVYNYLI